MRLCRRQKLPVWCHLKLADAASSAPWTREAARVPPGHNCWLRLAATPLHQVSLTDKDECRPWQGTAPPPTPLIHRIQIVGNKARRKIPSQKSFATVTLAPWVYFLTVWFSLCVFKWRKTTLDLSAVIENLLDPLMGWWVEPDEFSRKSEGIPGAELQRVKV